MSRNSSRNDSAAAANAAEDEWITSQSTIRNAIDNLYQIAVASRGPFGGAHLFHSNPSAPMIHLTQTCSILFSSISHAPSNVVWNLVQSLLQRNLDQLADGGWSIVQLIAGLARINHHRPFTHSSLSSLAHSSAAGSSPSSQTESESASMRIAPTFIPVHIALAGYQLSLGWCLEFLQEDFVTKQKQAQSTAASSSASSATSSSNWPHPVISFSMSNLPLLLNVIRSQFASKQSLLQLSSDENQYLSVLCIEAFLKGLNDPSGGNGSNGGFASNIRVQEVNQTSDKGVMDCKVFEGIVLDIPLPIHHHVAVGNASKSSSSALRSYQNLKTIIYNINLTFDPKELFSNDLLIHQTTMLSSSSGAASLPTAQFSYEEQLHGMMNALVTVWQKRGVNCVLSQKVIHPYLKQRCLNLGILPLERLSIRHIEAAISLAGGDLLSGIDVETANQAKLGSIVSLQEKLIGKRRYLFLSNTGASKPSAPAASPSICTFLVSARTSMQRAELVLTLTRLFKILTHLLKSPFVCAGAGSTEMSLAAELQRRLLERMRTKRAFYRQSLATVAEKIAAKYSKAPPSLVSQLAAAELELFRQHLQGLEKSDRLLHEAVKHFSEVLQDLACETVFRRNALSSSSSAGISSDNNQMLYEELKQLLRQYYNFPDLRDESSAKASGNRAASSSAQNRTSSAPNKSSLVAKQPSKKLQVLDSASVTTDPAESETESTARGAITLPPHAVFPLDTPVDETAAAPFWNPGADWQLQYESEHIFDEKIASATEEFISPNSTQPKIDRDPNALYGFNATNSMLWLVPVFRINSSTQSSNTSIKIDENTVLDPLYVKRAMLQVAVEAAGVLLKVDHIVPDTP